MKAAMIDRYGAAEEIKIMEGIKRPSMGKNDVLIRTIACGINAGDIEARKGHYKTLTLPGKKNRQTILGIEFSGVVADVGSAVANFKSGDEVYGSTHVFKGYKANAEFVAVPADFIVLKPAGFTHQEAASLPTGMITSIRAFRDIAKLQENQSLLINGASGAVGKYAIQLARTLGAGITAVCSESNFDTVRALGADRALDYRKEDFTKLKEQFDVIFDVVGSSSFRACKNVLKDDGLYISTNPQNDIFGFFLALFSSKKTGYLMAVKGSCVDLEYTNNLIEQGEIIPLVDKVFPFSRIVEAHRYFEENSDKVVLTMHDQCNLNIGED
jgi:NADPH:quinone reductase-like Zn-dependent oxidoreductase